MIAKQLVVLVLKPVHQDSTLYLLRKGTSLQFRLDHSIYGQRVELFCNYPIDSRHSRENKTKCYNRNEYYKVPLIGKGIELHETGNYRFYFTNGHDDIQIGSGYFIVEPKLSLDRNNSDDISSLSIGLDSIQCQTVLSKLLGHFTTWYNKLQVAYKSGYNMIHFTPIQELGDSNSCYSLKDQLTLNHTFGEGVTFDQMRQLLQNIRAEWGMLSIGDVVLNHTANESPWLMEHPEASYNCMNCPYLRPAYLLDAALARFSIQLSKGVYNVLPTTEDWTEEQLGTIRHLLQTDIVPSLRLGEMFMCDVTKYVAEFRERARYSVPERSESDNEIDADLAKLDLIQDKEYRRFQTTVDMDLALNLYNLYRKNCWDEESRLRTCVALFKQRLDVLNDTSSSKVQKSLEIAIDNCIAHIRYQRVDRAGPRLGAVTPKQPLVDRYFTSPRIQAGLKTTSENDLTLPWELVEHSAYTPPTCSIIMAHNGWVLSGNADVNFALCPAPVYLERSLIPWSDSVKLNYGSAPADSPFLWQHMRTYVEQTAQLFDGLRLDNCHSTPLHVAEAMVDAAREVNGDLYVLAELFTNDPSTDNVFVNRLGITALVRESMAAWNSQELGRVLHRYGGDPIGSFLPAIETEDSEPVVLKSGLARALLLDQSHDNESVIRKRSAKDAITNCALVCMAACAVGSTRGYDELIPHQINVVTEDREYAEWNIDGDDNPASADVIVNNSTGIIAVRRELNKLHGYLGTNNYKEIYIDQVDDDIVAVTRHNPDTQKSVLLVAYTAFAATDHNQIREVTLCPDGIVTRVRLESEWYPDAVSESFEKNPHTINGLSNMNALLRMNIDVEDSDMISVTQHEDQHQVHLHLTPGSVVVVDIEPAASTVHALDLIRTALPTIDDGHLKRKRELIGLDGLRLLDLNVLLYRCEEEERDSTVGAVGAYEVPGYGKLVYCGLQGFISVLSDIRSSNDVGHPLCDNLRNGPWMTDYIYQRLLNYTSTHKRLVPVADWLQNVMSAVATLPRYLRAAQFDLVLGYIHNEATKHAALAEQSLFQPVRDSLRDVLVNVAVQMTGVVPSAGLPDLYDGEIVEGSLCAGLPHFSTGYCRSWGRDTFISLRGLYILTGRHAEARTHILAYATCLRHGLIPNLLDGGTKPRYNCRDAVWWWLYCIKCYVLEVEGGESILGQPVRRLFAGEEGETYQPLCDVMQEAINVHFQGLVFREHNAGPAIDAHMSEPGFTVQIGVNPQTGFVFGGNVHNCGTWMDKMGHTGRPATPRDGSAVELVGLQYAVLSWLVVEGEDCYPFEGVTRTVEGEGVVKWTWSQWAQKIKENFERCFWIGLEENDKLVNRRNMYKDTYGSSQCWPDYQLRCNFSIAMVVAPKLFTPSRAAAALCTMRQHLLSTDENGRPSLGMRTLDTGDWNYRPDYDNTDNGLDETTAHGFNYHNGPEWVWPVGYYLRAWLLFPDGNLDLVRDDIMRHLASHNIHVHGDAWRGLPELTNGGGRYCRDSCRTQAWSAATILEVLYDLEMIQQRKDKGEDQLKATHSRRTH